MQVEIVDAPPRGRNFSVAFLHEGRDPAARVAGSVRGVLREACRASGFRAREKESAGSAAAGWALVGLGKAPASLSTLRRSLRRAVRDAMRHGSGRVLLAFDTGVAERELRALVREAAQADYRFDRYKTRARNGASAARVAILPPPSVDKGALADAAREAPVLADVIRWARDLGNTPANDLGPEDFAREARAMGRRAGVTMKSLERKAIVKERMGGLLAVNSGSVRPPVFLIGEHRPARSRGTAVLVGKGITFDSGGISIKPAASMGEMKYDMMGAATVFASLFAAARLKLPIRVVALAPLTENLPSGSACRPGDILRMRNGKTVEVDNTDAEGRLVLADALSYSEKFAPDVIVDFATLTGAVLIALGHDCAGLMSPQDDVAKDLIAAGEETGERLWRLPLWDDYRSNLKSEWADMRNTGGRAAGTINAGVFLKEFVPEGTAWAHIDFAGVAHLEKEHAGYDAGATGFGVALTIEFLRRRFATAKA
ncbi:MAG: leucyl aminopeptidase [Acidobacteriota bacterium]